MPAKIDLAGGQTTFVTKPVSPCAGRDFTVSWEDENVGDEDSIEYQDIFNLNDGDKGASKDIKCTPLARGERALRTLTFNLEAGDYTMEVVLNGRGPLTLGNVIINECS